jgi:hypothetical protein
MRRMDNQDQIRTLELEAKIGGFHHHGPQTTRTETGLGYFDNFDFNFDVNDVSWLNSVPFYQT